MKPLKFSFLVILLLFTFWNIHGQNLEFNHTYHNWGTVMQQNKKVSHRFHFTNTGDQPLRFFAMNPCCGCIIRERPSGTIGPGESSHITLECNISRLKDSARFTLELLTNEPVAPKTRLVMEGFVSVEDNPPEESYRAKMGNLMLESTHLNLGHLSKTNKATDTIRIYNSWDQAMDISFPGMPPHIEINVLPEQLGPEERGSLIITYDATKKDDYGQVMERFQMTTNDERHPKKMIHVSAILLEDFSHLTEKEMANAPVASYNESEHDFGNVKDGTTVTHHFTLKNQGNRTLKIRKIHAPCGCTASTPGEKTLKPGQETKIKVSFNTRGRSGRQQQTVTVITNDPANPSKTLRVRANVHS